MKDFHLLLVLHLLKNIEIPNSSTSKRKQTLIIQVSGVPATLNFLPGSYQWVAPGLFHNLGPTSRLDEAAIFNAGVNYLLHTGLLPSKRNAPNCLLVSCLRSFFLPLSTVES